MKFILLLHTFSSSRNKIQVHDQFKNRNFLYLFFNTQFILCACDLLFSHLTLLLSDETFSVIYLLRPNCKFLPWMSCMTCCLTNLGLPHKLYVAENLQQLSYSSSLPEALHFILLIHILYTDVLYHGDDNVATELLVLGPKNPRTISRTINVHTYLYVSRYLYLLPIAFK